MREENEVCFFPPSDSADLSSLKIDSEIKIMFKMFIRTLL